MIATRSGTDERRGFDVVFLFAVPWESYRQRNRHMASQLAKKHRVLYVEQVTRGVGRPRLPRILKVSERLTVLTIPFMLQPYHGSALKGLETRVTSAAIRALLKLLNFGEVVVIHCDYYTGGYVKRLGESLDVYDCLDDHGAFSWGGNPTAELENELIRRSDLVLTVSEPLAQTRSTLNRRTVVVPNAADLEFFAPRALGTSERPSDIAMVPTPILGFVGSLFDWVDQDLLRQLAVKNPDWSIVIIGPARCNVDRLRGISNIHVLGERPYHSLPAYVHSFDVALVPFKVNTLTENADMIKVYEYLAAGRPVVSTDLPAVHRFKGMVRIGADFDSFEMNVREALRDRSEASVRERIRSVEGHDWVARAALAERLIEESLAAHSSTSPGLRTGSEKVRV